MTPPPGEIERTSERRKSAFFRNSLKFSRKLHTQRFARSQARFARGRSHASRDGDHTLREIAIALREMVITRYARWRSHGTEMAIALRERWRSHASRSRFASGRSHASRSRSGFARWRSRFARWRSHASRDGDRAREMTFGLHLERSWCVCLKRVGLGGVAGTSIWSGLGASD